MILAVEVFGLALVAAVARRQSGNAALACGKDKRPPEVTPATFVQFGFAGRTQTYDPDPSVFCPSQKHL